MSVKNFFVLILIITAFCKTIDAKKQNLSLILQTLQQKTGLTANEPFDLNTITYNSDIPLSKSEFFYLTDLSPSSTITLHDLGNTYKNLKNKKRFSSIEINLSKSKKNVHIILKAQWIFKQVSLHGILFGKNQYEDLYQQHPGDIFDITVHEESIETIKKHLQQQGYFNCFVADELIYNAKEKTITVKIRIKRGAPFHIDNISFNIKGTHNNDTTIISKKLYSHFSDLFINKRYTKKLLVKAKEKIKSILKKHGFSKPTTIIHRRLKKNKKASLNFDIHVGKKHYFSFHNNQFFTEKEILNRILDPDQPEWLFSPEIISQKLLLEYHKHGFWAATIQYKTITPNNYEIHINEGNQIYIDKIIVQDSQTKKEEVNKLFFQDLLNAKYYDESLFDIGIEKLKTFYIEHGFWNFTIQSKQFIKISETNRYQIIIIAHKGKQRFLQNINIKQFPNLEQTEFFQKYINNRDTVLPFNPSWLAEQRLYFLNHFQKQGYWYVDAKPEISITTPPPSKKNNNTIELASILWHIETGEKVSFDKVYIRGSTRLPFNRIMKTITFKQGDLWERKKLDHTRKKLKELQIFKHIHIQPKKLSNQQSKKPIVITLLDDDPFELKLRTGYFLTSKNFLLKRESTYKIGGSFLIKNPLNLADKLTLNTNFTRFERNIDVDYHVPQPLDLPVLAKGKVYSHKYVHPLEVGKSDSAYEAEQNGFLLCITKEYEPLCFWGVNIGNEWLNTSRARGNLNLAKNMIDTTIPYFFLEPNIVIDRLDDKLHTKKGSLTFISCKMMVPETNRSSTYKVILDRSMFHHFGHDLVGALRLRWGHIFKQRFEHIMPTERFFLGGPNSVRGYSKDTIPPLGKTIKTNNKGEKITEYTIQGGSSMLNGNIELRFPIYKAFGGVLFQDVGVLSQSGFCGLKKRWHPSSGFGFRYQTPIGSLRFDIGWKWKKSFSADTSYAWYLTLGQVF